MDPDLGRVRTAIEDALLLREDLFFRGEDLRGFVAKSIGQRGHFFFEQGKVAAQRGTHVLVNGALRHGIELLRRESALVGADGQSAMQLAGALAQQFGFLAINSADQFLEERAGRSGLVLQIGFPRQDPLVIAADGVERQRPGIAFIRDGALEQADDGRLGLGPAIFDRAEKRGDVWKLRALRQETGDFHIGIHAVFEFPE